MSNYLIAMNWAHTGITILGVRYMYLVTPAVPSCTGGVSRQCVQAVATTGTHAVIDRPLASRGADI